MGKREGDAYSLHAHPQSLGEESIEEGVEGSHRHAPKPEADKECSQEAPAGVHLLIHPRCHRKSQPGRRQGGQRDDPSRHTERHAIGIRGSDQGPQQARQPAACQSGQYSDTYANRARKTKGKLAVSLSGQRRDRGGKRNHP